MLVRVGYASNGSFNLHLKASGTEFDLLKAGKLTKQWSYGMFSSDHQASLSKQSLEIWWVLIINWWFTDIFPKARALGWLTK